MEFNCRFGDPETQVILPRLKGDLLPLLEATIDGRIDAVKIELDQRAAVTVVMASAGYPGNVASGQENYRTRRVRAAWKTCRFSMPGHAGKTEKS